MALTSQTFVLTTALSHLLAAQLRYELMYQKMVY